jgi:hypothetical protein
MVGSSRAGRTLGSLRLGLFVVAVLAIGVVQWFRVQEPASRPTSVETPAPAPPASPAPPARDTPAEPRRDLTIDEKQGGHTLARHVGKSDQDLRDRLDRERGISAASTYADRSMAESTVARALAREDRRVAAWLARVGNRPNLALTYHGQPGVIIGRSLERRRRDPIDCTDAVVVLRWNGRDGFFVLTSYPEAGR